MRKSKLKNLRITKEKAKRTVAHCRVLSAMCYRFCMKGEKNMDNKIFKQLFPGVDEKYLERAFDKLKKNGCP